MTKLTYFLSFFVVFSLAGCAISHKQEVARFYKATTNKPYDDVLAELKVAITDYNFRVTAHSRVGKVIRDRGTTDFPDYDTIQFCNLSHAKRLLQISPDAVRHMPCNVVLYVKQGKVIIETRLLPTDTPIRELNEFSEEMNGQLREIVDFAAEE